MAGPTESVETQVVLNLMPIYGPILIGAVLSCILYGMSCIQMFLYFLNYERDPRFLKCYVVLVWAVETTSICMVLSSLWPPLVLRWGSLAAVSEISLSLLHRAWVAGLGTFLVQLFYVYRIYLLSGKNMFIVLLVPFTVYQLAETIAYTVKASQQIQLNTLSGNVLIGLGTSGRTVIAFVDVMIVVAMMWTLLKNGYPKFNSSRRMVFRLLIITVNTGLWTAIFAVIDLALIVPFQDKLYWCAVDFPLTSLYLNALLANLNMREYIRAAPGDGDHNIYPMEEGTPGAQLESLRLNSQIRGPSIRIHTASETTSVNGDPEAAIIMVKTDRMSSNTVTG
ncbi:hypothetical protein LXA43DRAFT_720970 [Ganoderma leucocontextum]|nr:hypothetical protein LXA43DRAFT_720970 [Ganoderma leucocontextum]